MTEVRNAVLLELLDRRLLDDVDSDLHDEIVDALIAAASPQPPAPAVEPVAWHIPSSSAVTKDRDVTDRWRLGNPKAMIEPLYASPPSPAAIRSAALEEAVDWHRSEITRLEKKIEKNSEYASRSSKSDGRSVCSVNEYCMDQITCHRASIEALGRLRALKDKAPEDGWRPISEAKTDGTHYLAAHEASGVIRISWYGKTSHVPLYGWCQGDDVENIDLWDPTHFRLLPAPPAPEER